MGNKYQFIQVKNYQGCIVQKERNFNYYKNHMNYNNFLMIIKIFV